jgi:hypothetical protein
MSEEGGLTLTGNVEARLLEGTLAEVGTQGIGGRLGKLLEHC